MRVISDKDTELLISMCRAGFTQLEMAEALHITQPAVCFRINSLREKGINIQSNGFQSNICFDCYCAGRNLCEWDRRPHEPVPGWTAKKIPYKGGTGSTIDWTYRIIKCPKYQHEVREVPNYYDS